MKFDLLQLINAPSLTVSIFYKNSVLASKLSFLTRDNKYHSTTLQPRYLSISREVPISMHEFTKGSQEHIQIVWDAVNSCLGNANQSSHTKSGPHYLPPTPPGWPKL